MNRLFTSSILVAVLLGGCATEAERASDPPEAPLGHFYGATEPTPPMSGAAELYVPTPVTEEEVGNASMLPPPAHRTRIRMHIDQLISSIKEVTGGMAWASSKGKSHWTTYYSALGVPDYMSTVNEVLDTTLLFDKLLGDAARDICPKLLAQEKVLPVEERIFLTEVELSQTLDSHPDEIEKNLSYLALRFHGRYMPPGDPRLTPWKTLFSKAHAATENTEMAWTAVCVGLLTHPEFASF